MMPSPSRCALNSTIDRPPELLPSSTRAFIFTHPSMHSFTPCRRTLPASHHHISSWTSNHLLLLMSCHRRPSSRHRRAACHHDCSHFVILFVLEPRFNNALNDPTSHHQYTNAHPPLITNAHPPFAISVTNADPSQMLAPTKF